jgi:hypothetical protein
MPNFIIDTECGCPLCPLTSNNVNICGVKVTVENEASGNHGVEIPDEFSYGINKELAMCLCALVVTPVLHERPIKIGERWTRFRDEFTIVIEKRGRNKYNLCFHTKVVGPVLRAHRREGAAAPVDDPGAMD